MPVKTSIKTELGRTFIEKRIGDLILIRNLTVEDIYDFANPCRPMHNQKCNEFMAWSTDADVRLLESSPSVR